MGLRKTRGPPALEADACGSRKAQQRWGRAACRSLCLRGWLCRADRIFPERLAVSRRRRKPGRIQQNKAGTQRGNYPTDWRLSALAVAVTRLRLQVHAFSKLSGGQRGLTPLVANLPRWTCIICTRSGTGVCRTSLSRGFHMVDRYNVVEAVAPLQQGDSSGRCNTNGNYTRKHC